MVTEWLRRWFVVHFILDMAEFSLFSRRIRDAILMNWSSLPFVRAEIAYAGFKRYGVKYARRFPGRGYDRLTSF